MLLEKGEGFFYVQSPIQHSKGCKGDVVIALL